MDWSKAKNIIIAALLAANLLIGGNLLAQRASQQTQIRQATVDTVAFLQHEGMQIEAEVPQKTERLPVLFLRLLRAGEGAKDSSYKSYPVIVQGEDVGFEFAGEGQQAAQTISAADALLRLYAELSAAGSVKGKCVESVDLVYLLSSGETAYAAQDTAVPAWRIVVDGQPYYVNAYGE